jgi:hypothetical protein
MSLAFTHSPAWLLLILPLAAGLSFWMYRGTRETLPGWLAWTLMAARFLLLSAIGLLLLDPITVTQQRIEYPPIVAILQDHSESIRLQRDSSYAMREHPQRLQRFAEALESKGVQVDLFQFSDETLPLASPDSLRYNGEGSRLSDALAGLREQYQNQHLGAVLLISDGIPTSGISPAYEAERMRQPVYTLLLGDTAPQRDVSIREVLFNELAYLGTELPLRVKVAAQGYASAPLRVSLWEGQQRLDEQRLDLSAGKPAGEVAFRVKPARPGTAAYRIEVSRLDQEITYRNNSRQVYVNVLDTRLKIALFAGSSHPDIGALRKTFEREEGYEISEFILQRPGQFAEDPGKFSLADFDLFILHNFPQSQADEPWVKRLAEEARERKKPLMVFVGQFTDLRTLGPLYEHMALQPRSVLPNSEEAIANFLPAYARHASFPLGEGWLEWANAAPPVFRNQSLWTPRADAQVFATARIKNVQLDYPIYALQNQLGRKNMVFVGENFWRMRVHAFTEREDFEYFDLWLLNNVRWLMAAEDKRRFRVKPARRLFSSQEPALISGQVYDESYNPLPGADIRLTLQRPDGKEDEYFFEEPAPAQYELEIRNLPEGVYRYQARGSKDNLPLGEDAGQFSVGRSYIEANRLQADAELLRQVALRSGGRFARAQDLEALAEEIKALPGMKPLIDYRKQRRGLYDLGWVMVLLLTLAAAEWGLRKTFNQI